MRGVALVLRKDVRVLSRSPLLLALLVVYPLLVAGLVGAVVFVTQNLEELEHADRVAEMHQGRIVRA